MMIGTFKIDQAATFASVMFMHSSPKVDFTSKSPIPGKWQISAAVGYTVFGKMTSEIINVNVDSPEDPAVGITPGQPIELVGLEVNVSPKSKGKGMDKQTLTGVSQWFKADYVKAATAAAPTSGRKSASSEN
jgi:hypothetical protein